MDKVETILSKNMKTAMAEKGITNTSLFMQTGVPYSRIGDLLRSKTLDPRISTVKKVADGLGVSVDWLMADHSAEVELEKAS